MGNSLDRSGSADSVEQSELDLRRLAKSRFIRRTIVFLSAAFGAAILAKFSTDLLSAARSVGAAEFGDLGIPEGMVFEYAFGLFALGVVIHLAYAVALMGWRWRVFVPLLESRRAEEVAISLVNLTSIFAKAQRTAQSRSLVGAAAVTFGLVKVLDAKFWNGEFSLSDSLIPLLLSATGAVILLVSFWLRYALPHSRVVLVPLLEAVVGAESSSLDEAAIRAKVDEIMNRIRAQKPWWFYRPTWFY